MKRTSPLVPVASVFRSGMSGRPTTSGLSKDLNPLEPSPDPQSSPPKFLAGFGKYV